MSKKTINRVESSEGRFGTLLGASYFIENEGATITESRGLQDQLESIEEWNSMPGVVPEEVIPSRFRKVIRRRWASFSHSHVEISRWDWHSKVSSADNPEEIIELFRQSDNPKFNRIANRLRELQDFYEEDPEEGDLLTIEALRTLAFFVGNNLDLPYSHISVYSDGRVYLEWRLHPQGRLAMKLSPDRDLINFAAISATAEEGIKRKEVSGALPEKEAIEAVRWFINRIADNAKK